MDDMISRLEAIGYVISGRTREFKGEKWIRVSEVRGILQTMPSTQPEVRPIDYQDCSNAMLKMWMDSVVTDGEYNRIMDKLNAHWGKKDG